MVNIGEISPTEGKKSMVVNPVDNGRIKQPFPSYKMNTRLLPAIILTIFHHCASEQIHPFLIKNSHERYGP
jgi:hypothetical protein